MWRFLMGGLLVLLGVSSTILGAAFVRGPLFYWSDLSKAGALQMQALVVGWSRSFWARSLSFQPCFADARSDSDTLP